MNTVNVTELVKKFHERRNILFAARDNLKAHFVGLDDIIDRIIKSIEAWYVFPEAVSRPVIVNLWGLTGVGKTDLVRRLVTDLSFSDKFVEIQMGARGESWYESIADVLSVSNINENDPGILLLDEFQRFRTISDDEHEISEKDLRYQDIWTLLSDGKLGNEYSIKGSIVDLLMNELYYQDVRKSEQKKRDSKPGRKPKAPRAKGKEAQAIINKIFKDAEIASDEDEENNKDRKYKQGHYEAKRLKSLLRIQEPIEVIMTWDSEKRISMLYDALNHCKTYTGKDYSKLLIIVCGNLDEAYRMVNMPENADMDADTLHNFSKSITVVSIKTSLQKRFKAEQIARLGNVHVIYPALTKENYKEIIRRCISKIQKDSLARLNITTTFDETVNDLIYRNGVYPSQGVRPVFTTVSGILENALPCLLLQCVEVHSTKMTIRYDESTEKFIAELDDGNECTSDRVTNKDLDDIRYNINDDVRMGAAIHETGHVVVYCSMFKTTPTAISCRATDTHASGFTMPHQIHNSRQNVLYQIQGLLGGYMAEQLVFGKDRMSTGAQADIEMATTMAAQYVRAHGFNKRMSNTLPEYNDRAQNANTDMAATNVEIEAIMQEQKMAAKETISKYIGMLKELALTLFNADNQLKQDDIHKICIKYIPDLMFVDHQKTLSEKYRDIALEFFNKVPGPKPE